MLKPKICCLSRNILSKKGYVLSPQLNGEKIRGLGVYCANVTRTPDEYATQLPLEVPVDIHTVTVPEDIVLVFAVECPLFKI